MGSQRILIPKALEEAMDLPVAAFQTTTTPSPWTPPPHSVSVEFRMGLDGNRAQGFKYTHGGTRNCVTFSWENARKYYYNFEIWKEKKWFLVACR